MKRYLLFSGLAGASGLLGWRCARRTDEAAITKVLYKKLSYLQLDALIACGNPFAGPAICATPA